MIRSLAALALFVGLLVPASPPLGSSAEPGRRVVIAGEDMLFPLQSQGADGQPDGVNIDLLGAWARENDLKAAFLLAAPTDARDLFLRGEADLLAPAPFAPDAPPAGVLLSRPYYELKIHLFYHKSLSGVNRLDELAGARVGIVAGSAVGRAVRDRLPFGAVICEYPDLHALITGAALGEIDAFPAAVAAANRLLTLQHVRDEFLYSEQPVAQAATRVAVKAADEALLRRLDERLRALDPQAIRRLEARRLGRELTAGAPWRVAGLALLTLAGLMAVAIFWNWQLRAKVRAATGELRGLNAALAAEVEERRRAQEETLVQKAYFEQLFKNSPEAIVVLDARGVTAVNRAFEALFGYSREELRGSWPAQVIVPEELRGEPAALPETALSPAVVEVETTRRRRDGGLAHVSLVCFPIAIEGKQVGGYIIYRDISRRKSMEEDLFRQAFHDALTGLPNRALFMDRLGGALRRGARDAERLFATLFIDLDRFKVVNDSMGHVAGDRMIREIGRRLAACARDGDTVARIGGDEFAILLDGLDRPESAEIVAERLLDALREPLRLEPEGAVVHATASVGVVVGPAGYERPELMLRDADIAMYRAKEQGKNRVMVFTPAMRDMALALMSLESDLRRAMEHDEFEVWYQPIVRLGTGELAGFEALLRWRHPERGVVMPGEFIGLAEETGLIVPIGQQVLSAACRQARLWRQRWPSLSGLGISVNLSARQFARPDLAERIRAVLQETGLPADRLNLEITESVVMDDAAAAENLLLELGRLGVRLSIDDFGTGYSSLSYLHRFSIDCLKIDRSFIRRMHGDGGHAEIVRTILLLSQTLGLEVVAEGVELDSQREALKAMGCDFAQGYLFARPMSPEAADRYLADWVGLSDEAGEPALLGPDSDGPKDDGALSRRRALVSEA